MVQNAAFRYYVDIDLKRYKERERKSKELMWSSIRGQHPHWKAFDDNYEVEYYNQPIKVYFY